jgi:hypothetical protein
MGKMRKARFSNEYGQMYGITNHGPELGRYSHFIVVQLPGLRIDIIRIGELLVKVRTVGYVTDRYHPRFHLGEPQEYLSKHARKSTVLCLQLFDFFP